MVDSNNLQLYTYVKFLLSGVIAPSAVPLFFFISGYLFFKGQFNVETYKSKLKKRCRTLLFPYLFWNLSVAGVFFLLQTFMPEMTSGSNKLIVDYTLSDWLRIFWDSQDGMPICYQFWFIRDLMVVMVFSPLLYYGIKTVGRLFVVILGLLWFFNIWPDVTGFDIKAFFFFTAGAYFNISEQNFLVEMRPLTKWSIILYPVLCALCMVLMDTQVCKYVLNLSIVIGLITAFVLTGHFIKIGKWRVNHFLAESSFFIYAYHAMVLALIVKLGVKLMINASSIGLLVIYFTSIFLTVTIGLILYYLLKTYMPTFTSLITGNR